MFEMSHQVGHSQQPVSKLQQASPLLTTFDASCSSSRITQGADVLLLIQAWNHQEARPDTALTPGLATVAQLPATAAQHTPSRICSDSSAASSQQRALSSASLLQQARKALALPVALATWPWRSLATAAGSGITACMAATSPAASLIRGLLGSSGTVSAASDSFPHCTAHTARRRQDKRKHAGMPASHNATEQPAGSVGLLAHSQVLALWSDRLAREVGQAVQAGRRGVAGAAAPAGELPMPSLISAAAAAAAPPPGAPKAAAVGQAGVTSCQQPRHLSRDGWLDVYSSAADALDVAVHRKQGCSSAGDIGRDGRPQAAAGAVSPGEKQLQQPSVLVLPVHCPGVGPDTWALALGLMYPIRPAPVINWVSEAVATVVYVLVHGKPVCWLQHLSHWSVDTI
jgi:hypothetical protein